MTSPKPLTGEHNIEQAIARAYALAGVSGQPSLLTAALLLRERIAARPTAAQIAASRAAEAVDVPADQVEQWLDDVTAEVGRAATFDLLRGPFADALRGQLQTRLLELSGEAARAVAPAATKASTRLARAAAKLPDDQPLDPAAVLAADAGPALRDTLAALDELLTYRAVWPSRDPGSRPLPADLIYLAPLLEVVPTAVEQRDYYTEQVINAEQVETSLPVRRLVYDAAGSGLRERPDHGRLLLDVARDRYAGVRLRLATDWQQVQTTLRRLEEAATIQRGEPRHPLPMPAA